jgi:hypothetical protein
MQLYSKILISIGLPLLTACGSSNSKEESKLSCQLTFNQPTIEETFDYYFPSKNLTDCAGLWNGNKAVNISYDVSKSYPNTTMVSLTFVGDTEQIVDINKNLNHTTISNSNKPVLNRTVSVTNVTSIIMHMSYNKVAIEKDSWYEEYGEMPPTQKIHASFYVNFAE